MVTYSNDHHLLGLSAYFLEFEDGDEMVMSLVDDFLALTSNGMVFFSIYAVCGHEYVYKDNNPKFEAHDTHKTRIGGESLKHPYWSVRRAFCTTRWSRTSVRVLSRVCRHWTPLAFHLNDLLGLLLLIDVPRTMNPGKRPKKKQHDIYTDARLGCVVVNEGVLFLVN
jgi:hypothetical protein